MLSLIQFTASNSTGFSLKLIPRDSPESPLYFGIISQSEKLEQLINLSKARNCHLSPETIRLKLSLDDLYYVVSVRIGSPSIPLFLALDTGSTLTWTQCKPCVNCYRQIPPIYDSRTSRTYRQIPCNHPICLSNRKIFNCVNQKCVYNFPYTGGCLTRGTLSQETFEFLLQNRSSLIFGCSTDNQNMPFAYTGKIAGILGLSLSAESIVQQLGNVINHRFSYCLVPLNQARKASSFLRFGDDIPARGRSFRSTPIVSPPDSYHYYVNLIDISVNGQRLGIPPGTFSIKRDGTGGTIIDSGAPATFIHHNAYDAVLRAFANYYAHLRIRRYEGKYRGLDLCYKYTPRFDAYASMAFHFEGADLTVDPKFVYVFVEERSIFCVPVLPTSSKGRSMIGAVHQQNTRFIFDNNNRILQFASENCISDANY